MYPFFIFNLISFQFFFNKSIVIIKPIFKGGKNLMDFYKESIVELEAVITEITARLNVIRKYMKINNTRDPIEYIKSRIKSENSERL